MDIFEIVELFRKHGFKIKNVGDYFYLKTEDLEIGIFDQDYPNNSYCGCIVAEHIDNFDKRYKSFYKASFPKNEEEFKLLLEDLKYISNEANKKSGNG